MTPEQIIQWARECGMAPMQGAMMNAQFWVYAEQLAAFAKLAAAHTRAENPAPTPDIHYSAFAELRSGHLVVTPDNMVGANVVFVFDGETKNLKSVGKK